MDYKSKLNEWSQKNYPVSYSHERRGDKWIVTCVVRHFSSISEASTKKEAEQITAEEMYKRVIVAFKTYDELYEENRELKIRLRELEEINKQNENVVEAFIDSVRSSFR